MDELLGRQSAFQEAEALYRMIGDEHTVEELRELIAVQPKIDAVLRAYAQAFPEEAYFVDRALKFRQAVAREFERMVRDSYDKIDAVPPLSLPPFTMPLDLPHLGQERSP